MTEIKLKWVNQPQDDVVQIERVVREDLSCGLYADLLDKPWNLLSHTVFLGPSMEEGPVVHVWGTDGDDHFNCQWEPDIKWVSIPYPDA